VKNVERLILLDSTSRHLCPFAIAVAGGFIKMRESDFKSVSNSPEPEASGSDMHYSLLN
jgi:hypothetical protein